MPGLAGPRLGIQPVHQVNRVVEARFAAAPHAVGRDCDCDVCFPRARPADDDQVALLVEEPAIMPLADEGLVDRRRAEVELRERLGQGNRAMPIW